MRYKTSTALLLMIISLFLLSYLFAFPNKPVNEENRTLATFDMVFRPEKSSVVYHESPVERMEAALSDQFLFREPLVKRYLSILNASDSMCRDVFGTKLDDQELQYSLQAIGNYVLIEDSGYLTVFPTTSPFEQQRVTKHIDQIEQLHSLFPDMGLYVYYVTQAFDTNWFDAYIGMKTPDPYQEIQDALPDYVKSGHLVYEDLDDYMDIHYKTDHHWNHRGARRGYEDVYWMLSEDVSLGAIRVPAAENAVSQSYDFVYLGSYGRALGDLYPYGYDDFSFYEYELPQRATAILDPDTREEIEVSSLGLYEEYRRGEINRDIGEDHYITLYGTALGKDGTRYSDGAYAFVLRNSEGNGKNLLLCGDSYNRAMRDVLASHFDTTVYLDYRLLSRLPIDYLVETYEIDVLLISSNTSMWDADEYYFTFVMDEK